MTVTLASVIKHDMLSHISLLIKIFFFGISISVTWFYIVIIIRLYVTHLSLWKPVVIRNLITLEPTYAALFLYIVITFGIDLKFVLTFPIIPTPLSLSYYDGSLMNRGKGKLMYHLEGRILSTDVTAHDAYVVNRMFLIRTLAVALSLINIRRWSTLPTHQAYRHGR